MKQFIIILMLFLSLLNFKEVYSQSNLPKQMDLVLVIDNSGSMRKNDPNFFSRKAIYNFIDSLPNNFRVSCILFDDMPKLLFGFKTIQEIANNNLKESIANSLTYTGRYTNIPSAIERAIYELKQNGKKDCEKIIIFMTDGIIETKFPNKDIESRKWLKEELTSESKTLGIKIYSIAFTEQADYELIQSLSQKTDGNYFRALKADDIKDVFNTIKNIATRVEINPIKGNNSKQVESINSPKDSSSAWLFYLLITIIILSAIAFFFYWMKKKNNPTETDHKIPEAYLLDVDGITGKPSFPISKNVMRIGRKETNDIPIQQETVSSFHATIEYKDGVFYLVDQDSLNGTFKQDEKLTKYQRIPIKSGNEIAFSQYKFQFKCEKEGTLGGTVIRLEEETPSGNAE